MTQPTQAMIDLYDRFTHGRDRTHKRPGQTLAAESVQLGLGVEEINVARAAFHEEEDDPLGPASMMGGGCGRGRPEHSRQCHCSKSTTRPSQKIPTTHEWVDPMAAGIVHGINRCRGTRCC